MKRKYRILIVEDEEIESRALVMMLKYNRQDIEQVDTAANSIQALELYKSFQPHVVFMDINLPGVSGLEVIRQMQYRPGFAKVVIVSAHSQFAYAQEALRLGVQDFLVKPISLENINRVLDDLIIQIEKTQSREEALRTQRSKLDAIRPTLERDCVLSIASMRSETPLATLFDFMQVPVNSGFVFIVKGDRAEGVMLREIRSRMRSLGIQCLGEIIHENCVCVALGDRPFLEEEVKDIVQYLKKELKIRERGCFLGVGSSADCADDLRRSYEQAMENGRQAYLQSLSPVLQTDAGGGMYLMQITEEAGKLVQKIRSGDSAGLRLELNSFFASLQMLPSFHRIQETAYSLYILILGNFPELSGDLQPFNSAAIFSAQDATALNHILQEALMGILNLLEGQTSQQSNQIVAKAMQMIKARYREDLTLDDVAEELDISLFYLSKLFRKEAGASFTEYLTQVRIDHAQRLLEEGNLSIKEVAYAAGFNSQSYFSKIFKKYTGKSPSEVK